MMNPELKRSIQALKAASKKRDQAIWSKLADELDRSKRSRIAVNVSDINRHTQSGDTVAVPGKVLASGSLDHAVTVAAFGISEEAKKKIAKAEGSAISLLDLLESGVEPSKIKIIK